MTTNKPTLREVTVRCHDMMNAWRKVMGLKPTKDFDSASEAMRNDELSDVHAILTGEIRRPEQIHERVRARLLQRDGAEVKPQSKPYDEQPPDIIAMYEIIFAVAKAHAQ